MSEPLKPMTSEEFEAAVGPVDNLLPYTQRIALAIKRGEEAMELLKELENKSLHFFPNDWVIRAAALLKGNV